jgi:hypothetical protein
VAAAFSTAKWGSELNTQIRNNFNDFTELQFVRGNQSIETNSLGPNQWISHYWDYRNASVGHRYLKENVGAWISIPVSIWCDHHLLHAERHIFIHRVDQAVECGLWNCPTTLQWLCEVDGY